MIYKISLVQSHTVHSKFINILYIVAAEAPTFTMTFFPLLFSVDFRENYKA